MELPSILKENRSAGKIPLRSRQLGDAMIPHMGGHPFHSGTQNDALDGGRRVLPDRKEIAGGEAANPGWETGVPN